MVRKFVVGVLFLAAVSTGFERIPSPLRGETAPADLSPEERDPALREQARLWQDASQLRRDGKLPECREAVEKASALEKKLFGDATHTLLFLTEYAANLDEFTRDLPSALKARREAAALQLRFLGDLPAASAETTKRLEQALDVRGQALGAGHRWVGLTLVDLALAQEAEGKADAAEASLKKALEVFRALPFEPGFSSTGFLTDANYHLDRLRLSAAGGTGADALSERLPGHFAHFLEDAEKRCNEAEQCEQKGDIDRARTLLRQNLTFQGFGGENFSCSERAQLEMARKAHEFLSRYLSFESRAGAAAKAAGSYPAISSFKGAIYTQLRSIRLERYHPSLKPFFDAYDEVTHRLAALSSAGDAGDDAKVREARSLAARRDALEAEMGRRRDKLPQFMNAPAPDLLPPGAVLVDYVAYEYVPLPGEAVNKDGPDRRLACFVSRKGQPTAYLDLGPLAPVADAVNDWRRAIRKHGGGVDRGFMPDDPQGPGVSGAPQLALRKQVWEPLQPYLDKAEVVLISPDGPLSSLPFAALPGSRPGSYLLEEFPIVLAPIPRLIAPLKSETEFLAKRDSPSWSLREVRQDFVKAPLLVGDVDFGEPAPAARLPALPALPGTAREITDIADVFERQFPDRRADRLTGKRATKTAFRAEAPRHEWLHLATHGYYLPARPGDETDQPELRSALALAGANAGAAAGDDDGVLTALEAASLDLDGVDLAVLSACETGLGEVQEGEGVLGLQRAFLAAGAKATVASLWSIDDDATRALMAEFYRNLWVRKLGPAEALRQAQQSMLKGDLYRPPGLDDGDGKGARLPPFYWAAFLMAGDWRLPAVAG